MSQPDPARQRFIMMQIMRLSGAAFFLVGLLTVVGKIDMPKPAGYMLLAVGLFDLLVMPVLMAKRWKSPPQ